METPASKRPVAIGLLQPLSGSVLFTEADRMQTERGLAMLLWKKPKDGGKGARNITQRRNRMLKSSPRYS
jgi:hypothetical protein